MAPPCHSGPHPDVVGWRSRLSSQLVAFPFLSPRAASFPLSLPCQLRGASQGPPRRYCSQGNWRIRDTCRNLRPTYTAPLRSQPPSALRHSLPCSARGGFGITVGGQPRIAVDIHRASYTLVCTVVIRPPLKACGNSDKERVKVEAGRMDYPPLM